MHPKLIDLTLPTNTDLSISELLFDAMSEHMLGLNTASYTSMEKVFGRMYRSYKEVLRIHFNTVLPVLNIDICRDKRTYYGKVHRYSNGLHCTTKNLFAVLPRTATEERFPTLIVNSVELRAMDTEDARIHMTAILIETFTVLLQWPILHGAAHTRPATENITRTYIAGIAMFLAFPTYKEKVLLFEERFVKIERLSTEMERMIRNAFSDGTALTVLALSKQEKAFGHTILGNYLRTLPGLIEDLQGTSLASNVFTALYRDYRTANEHLREDMLPFSLIRPNDII